MFVIHDTLNGNNLDENLYYNLFYWRNFKI